jgi:hypothetical protein
MNDVTQIRAAIEQGETRAVDQPFPCLPELPTDTGLTPCFAASRALFKRARMRL